MRMPEVPADFEEALRAEEGAWESFSALSERDQAHLIELVVKARDHRHRQNRIRWIVLSFGGSSLLVLGAAVALASM